MRQRWTLEEEEFLKNNYGIISNIEIAKVLLRTARSIALKRHSLDLIVSSSRRTIITIGEKFGMLTAIQEAPSRKGNIMWECLCECGNTHTFRGATLRHGDVNSCGCSHFEDPGIASYRRMYDSYKQGAKKRNLEFLLIFEEFATIISKNCKYCGSVPVKYNRYIKKNTNYQFKGQRKVSESSVNRSWICINGIDRANNDLGYTSENCVSCCSYCNYMKLDKSEESFLAHAERIVNHQKSMKP
jgi:hypothetical protein